MQAAAEALASMRPARKGPENHADAADLMPVTPSFNEAGPQGAGKPSTDRGRDD